MKARTYTTYILYYILIYIISYTSYKYILLLELMGIRDFTAHLMLIFVDILSFFIVITDHLQTKKLAL